MSRYIDGFRIPHSTYARAIARRRAAAALARVGLADGLAEPREPAGDGAVQQAVLVLVVVIDDRRAAADALGDAAHRDAVDALLLRASPPPRARSRSRVPGSPAWASPTSAPLLTADNVTP